MAISAVMAALCFWKLGHLKDWLCTSSFWRERAGANVNCKRNELDFLNDPDFAVILCATVPTMFARTTNKWLGFQRRECCNVRVNERNDFFITNSHRNDGTVAQSPGMTEIEAVAHELFALSSSSLAWEHRSRRLQRAISLS